jgi:hypothetical protein
VFVVGDIPELGAWDPHHAVPLTGMNGSWDIVGPSHFIYSWSATVQLAQGKKAQFKFIMIDQAGNVTWESGPDRTQTFDGHIDAATQLSYYPSNTIYTYADYWNRANGLQCQSTYDQYVNYLNWINSRA